MLSTGYGCEMPGPGIALPEREPGMNQHAQTQISPFFKKEHPMNITPSLTPIVALIAGMLILAVPRLLNYIVAIYLITIGVLGLLGANGIKL